MFGSKIAYKKKKKKKEANELLLYKAFQASIEKENRYFRGLAPTPLRQWCEELLTPCYPFRRNVENRQNLALFIPPDS